MGVVYLFGRLIYWRAYVSDPNRRGLGFMLSMLPAVRLAAQSLIGVGLSMAGLDA